MSQSLEVEEVETKNHNTEQKIQLFFRYFEKQRHQLPSKMKKQLKRTLQDDIKTIISYKSTTEFPVRNKADLQHKHNVVYYGKCPNEGCKDGYVGETKRRIVEKFKDHNNKDNSYYLLKHAVKMIAPMFGRKIFRH